jgi:Na+/H+-dicarboxylate symporter
MKLKLHWQILIAFFVAILFGLLLTEYVKYVTWLGDLFLRALKMVIIPLVFSSIVSGVTNIGGGKNLGRLGIKTIIYYIGTSTLAILTGLFFVNILKPGVGADLGFTKEVEGLAAASESFGTTLLNIIPVNIFQSFTEMNMLQIIFFAILFGFFISQTETKYQTALIDFFNSVFEVIMKLTMFIIKFTPLGIFGIVSGIVAEQAGNPSALMDIVGRLSIYMAAVISALIIHSAVTLPLIVKIIGRVNPIKHLKAMTTPLLTAFSTASSNATLPLTMEAVEKNSGVSNKITSFTLPLGATINMDGTALYECVAAIFIAQAYGIELTIVQQIIVVITALLASIGAAGIPMAGLVMMSIVLTAVGLPLEGVGLILAVDRLLDMFRTTVNVWSDSCGAVVIAKTEGETLNVE